MSYKAAVLSCVEMLALAFQEEQEKEGKKEPREQLLYPYGYRRNIHMDMEEIIS